MIILVKIRVIIIINCMVYITRRSCDRNLKKQEVELIVEESLWPIYVSKDVLILKET